MTYFCKAKEAIDKRKHYLIISMCFIALILNTIVVKNINVSIFLLFAIYTLITIDALVYFKQKMICLLFFITFFIFSMGQYIFKQTEPGMFYTMYSNQTVLTTILLQAISLIFVFVGGCIKFNFHIKESEPISKNFKIVLLILFYGAFTIAVLSKIDYIIQVWKYGYMVLYNGEIQLFFPSFIHYFGQAFPLVFFLCVTFEKEDRLFKYDMIFYFVYLILSLLTGVRGEFGIGLLIVCFLYVKRKYSSSINNFNHPRKYLKIIAIVCVLLMTIFLNIYNSYRVDHSLKEFNPITEISSFFVNQSNSVNVICSTIENDEVLNQHAHFYVLGPVLDNIARKLSIFGYDNPFSKYNTSLAKDISIIELGYDGYKSGQGVGSQYIAELYSDYSYLGVIVYNLMLGILFKLMNKVILSNSCFSYIFLCLLQSLWYLPRGQALQFINILMSSNFWFLLILMVIFNILVRTMNKNGESRNV